MNKYLISPLAGVVAFLCFFAPWVSCGNMATFNGMDLATGSGMGALGDMGGQAGDSGADPLLFSIPLAAIAIVALFVVFRKARLSSAMIPTIIVTLIALFVMGLKYMSVEDTNAELRGDTSATAAEGGDELTQGMTEMMGNMTGLTIKWGFWLTAVAFIVAAAGATQYRDLPKRPEDVMHPGTAMEAEPPGEVVSSEPPPDASMTEDKGMG